MKILGIDPGTGKMGWAILETGNKRSDRPKLVDCGLIKTKANTFLAERLCVIFSQLNNIIKKYNPSQLAIEELFFVKNVKTAISVSHARGVALLVAKLAEMEVFEYKPNEIKLAITGFGHADKKQIARTLKLHLKECNISQDDTADAVAVVLTHLQLNRSRMRIKC